jgi:hypothetical protein
VVKQDTEAAGTGDVEHQVDVMDAAVQELASPADGRVVAPGRAQVPPALPVRVGGLDPDEAADAPLVDRPLRLDRRAHRAVGLAVEQDHAGFPGGRDHRVALRERFRERLLTQDVLASADRGDHRFRVEVVGRADLDGVDVGVAEDGVERVDGAGAVAGLGRRARPPFQDRYRSRR